MNQDDLESFIANADCDGLAEAAEKLTESERKKISRAAQNLYKQIEKSRLNVVMISGKSVVEELEFLKKWIKEIGKPDVYEQYNTAGLAVLAFCSFTSARKINARFYEKNKEDTLIKILSDRKPEWINEWINEKLKGEWQQISWETLRTLINNGICSKPDSDDYIRLMAVGLPSYNFKEADKYIPLSNKIKEDPSLLDDEIWKLFKVETNAFIYDWENHASLPANYESWVGCICKLSTEGLLDRQKLINSSLKGLTSGFKNNMLSGYIKVHDKLEPSVDEIHQRQEIYLDLLLSQSSHVVTFALKILKELDKNNLLDDEKFVNSISILFNITTKSQPLAALKILTKILKRSPELINNGIQGIITGLIHQSVDVQSEVISILEEYINADDTNSINAIIMQKDSIAQSLQNKIMNIISKANLSEFKTIMVNNCSSSIDDYNVNYNVESYCSDEIKSRISNLSENVREKFGLVYPVIDLNDDLFLPFDCNINDLKIIPSLQIVKPIDNTDELLETVAHALETVDSAIEVERIIDGISRLCNKKDSTFERLAEPVFKRAEKLGELEGLNRLVSRWGGSNALQDLLSTWLSSKRLLPKRKFAIEGPMRFIENRIYDISERVSKNISAPLLSFPTHENGWIDPEILIERIIMIKKLNINIASHDFIQALLRITPDNRAAALEKSLAIKGPEGKIIQYALGADDKPGWTDNKLSSLWLAAGRARFPYSTLDDFKKLKLIANLPDTIEPAKYSWTSSQKEYVDQWSKKTYYHPDLTISSGNFKIPDNVSSEWPTVLMHVQDKIYHSVYFTNSAWLNQWIRMIWPQNVESYYAAGAKALLSRIDYNASSHEPIYMFLEPMLEKYRTFSELSYIDLTLALSGKDADARGLAIDIMAEAIQNSRIHYKLFGKTIAGISKGEWLKLNRLCDSFTEVSRLSPTHAYVVCKIIMAWLSNQKELPRDAHYILSLLNELIIQLGITMDRITCHPLNSIKGTGKTAKLAKALLTNNPARKTNDYYLALSDLINSRIDLAESFS
ncbi:MAG: DUF6493 family protein [Cyanobacteriota bacterium]